MRAMCMCAAVTIAVLLASGGTAAAAPAPPGSGKASCSDVPIWVSVVPADGGILSDDTKGPYKANVEGIRATINICGASPTYDAVLSPVRTTRSIGFAFPPALPGSIIVGPSPVWANGVRFWTKPSVNVRNILWGRMNGQYTFTTRVVFHGLVGPGDKSLYGLRLQAELVDAIATAPPFSDINLPSSTATVTVQDVPGTCRSTVGGTKDSWIVTVDAPYVGTLYRETNPTVHSGQYVTPFRLLIEAQTCIPASLTR